MTWQSPSRVLRPCPQRPSETINQNGHLSSTMKGQLKERQSEMLIAQSLMQVELGVYINSVSTNVRRRGFFECNGPIKRTVSAPTKVGKAPAVVVADLLYGPWTNEEQQAVLGENWPKTCEAIKEIGFELADRNETCPLPLNHGKQRESVSVSWWYKGSRN